MKKILKKMSMWFKSKKELISILHNVGKMMDSNVNELVLRLEPLDQDKIHLLILEDASQEEFSYFMQMYEQAKNRMKWTPPKMFFTNKKIQTLSQKDLKSLIKRIKKECEK